MAIYRQVHITFWQDPFILDLTPEEKYFYLYLMTNSKTSQCGIYELPKKIIQLETGYNDETVDKLIQRFIEYGKVMYDECTKEIILLNWMKHNKNTSPRVKDRIKKELQDVKNPDYISIFLDACKQYEYSMDTVSIPNRNKNQNQNKNNNKHTAQIDDFFESLWKLYPNKKGKGRISDTQKKRLHKLGYDTLKTCIERYMTSKEDWQKWQHGSTFFNSGYIDYLDENFTPPPTLPCHRKYSDLTAKIGDVP